MYIVNMKETVYEKQLAKFAERNHGIYNEWLIGGKKRGLMTTLAKKHGMTRQRLSMIIKKFK